MSAAGIAAARAWGLDPVDLGLDPEGRREETRVKLERVGRLLDELEADELVVRRAENLAWLTGGADLLVDREGAPVADAVATRERLTIITSRIEAGRLEAEELPPGVHLEIVDWFDEGARARRVAGLTQGERVADDGEVDLTALRRPLLDVERARFAAIGGAASRALTDVAGTLRREDSERDVAAKLQGALRTAGVDLRVALVAGERRFGHVRHPVPTDTPFGACGLLVVCAARFGLVASLSRTVAFGQVPEPLSQALERVLRIEAAMLGATRPGVATREVFAAARAAYAAEGMTDAWRDHHQGGPAGYRPRDWLATPDEGRPLDDGIGVAWNPSLPWAKAEDTFLLHDGRLDALTWDERWPHAFVDGRPRALVRTL